MPVACASGRAISAVNCRRRALCRLVDGSSDRRAGRLGNRTANAFGFSTQSHLRQQVRANNHRTAGDEQRRSKVLFQPLQGLGRKLVNPRIERTSHRNDILPVLQPVFVTSPHGNQPKEPNNSCLNQDGQIRAALPTPRLLLG